MNNIKQIKNKCTGKIYTIQKSKIQDKIEQRLYSDLSYFLKDNLKNIDYLVSNNIFASIEYIQKCFEFEISEHISFCFDISKIESDLSNNCCDGVQVFFNNTDLQVNNLYLYSKIINSAMFKYYYYIIYSILEGIKYHCANTLHNCEYEEDNYFIDSDFIQEVYNSSIDFIIE